MPSFPSLDGSRRWPRIVAIAFGALFLVYFVYLVLGLPDLTDLENVNPAQATRIYSVDNKIIHELFTHNRIWVTLDRVPDHVVQAVIATEDRAFYDHWGINLKSFPRAVLANLRSLSFSQGFSTITMQVARNLFIRKIGFDRSISRKLREMITAIQIERTYSKREILEMYLNVSYFGRGSYGIQSAARKYFSKEVRDLSLEEGAYLVGLLKGPAYYHPRKYYDRAVQRRNVVMNNMVVCDWLSEARYDTLKVLPLETATYEEEGGIAPYFTEYVRQQLNDLQNELGVNVYEDGLNVYTTLDYRYQALLDTTIAREMPAIQARARTSLQPWKEENAVSDSVFEEKSVVQIAAVVLDQHTGQIRAMVGGRDFETSKFNRAVQAKRQPGSTFKPFLYAAAIDNGYKPSDKLLNQPIVITNPDGTRWTPENFDRTFGGLTTLRTGLKKSLNLIASRLILEIGPQVVVDYARQMGLSTPLRPYPSLAMGSSSVIPLEMVSAFGVFANDGVLVEPVSILRIEDRYGNVLWQSRPRRTEALNRSTAYIVNHMLQDAINNGTGGSARWRYNFYAPAGGKTGTTNDYTDAWFIGFTPLMTTGVWVGFDDQHLKLGSQGTGAGTALPFWGNFMHTLYDSLDLPHTPFQQPADVIQVRICDESGEIATNFCPTTTEEIFKLDAQPVETCHLHPGANSGQGRRRPAF